MDEATRYHRRGLEAMCFPQGDTVSRLQRRRCLKAGKACIVRDFGRAQHWSALALGGVNRRFVSDKDEYETNKGIFRRTAIFTVCFAMRACYSECATDCFAAAPGEGFIFARSRGGLFVEQANSAGFGTASKR